MSCQRERKRAAALAMFCALLLALTSCRHLLRGDDDVAITRANADMTLVTHRVGPAATVPGKKSLTLEDCRSIALANNLDLGIARIEELAKEAIAYSLKTKLLPRFFFTGDLSERSALRFSYSDVLGQEGLPPNIGGSGTGVTSFSTGHERSTWLYTLETRLSPTDLALAYYLVQSGGNDRVRAHHRKLRVAQKLVETVDSAYFRLLGLQECLPSAERLVSIRQGIKTKTGNLLESRLFKTEDYTRAEQKEIRARQLLSRLRLDIEAQRNLLASAMAVSPDYHSDGGFRVAGVLTTPVFDVPMPEMELTAVQNRPEAYEAGLAHLNSANDLRRTIVKYFPKVTGFWRYTRDKDKFLYEKEWQDVGISIYLDLADWWSNRAESRAVKIGVEKTRREIGAVALGIASQVRVAALKHYAALEDLAFARASVESLKKMVIAAENRYLLRDMEKIAIEEAQADLTEARLAATRALGESNATLAELQSAMGTNYREAIAAH